MFFKINILTRRGDGWVKILNVFVSLPLSPVSDGSLPSRGSLSLRSPLPDDTKNVSVSLKNGGSKPPPYRKLIISYIRPLFRGKCYYKPRPMGEVAPLGDGEGQKNKMNNEKWIISVDFAPQNPHFTFDFKFPIWFFPCLVFKRIGVWGKENFFQEVFLPPHI